MGTSSLGDVTRVRKEVGEEAKVEEASPLVEVEVEKYWSSPVLCGLSASPPS